MSIKQQEGNSTIAADHVARKLLSRSHDVSDFAHPLCVLMRVCFLIFHVMPYRIHVGELIFM